MRLPFINNKGFEILPGERPACSGAFKRAEIDALLEKNERKVLGTAARFLRVPQTEIVEIIPMSNSIVSIIFAQKEMDLYEYGDEDE
jgi:hypothetical protein